MARQLEEGTLKGIYIPARAERERLSHDFFVAREKRRKLDREIASYLRQRDSTVDPQQDEGLLSLRQDATRLSGDVDRRRGDLDRARERLAIGTRSLHVVERVALPPE